MSIFITSDLHFYHNNIIRFCNRPFKNWEEMNDVLVNNINKKVKQNDTLFHLGDWAFGSFDNVIEIRKRINCKNIHIILGNHDKPYYFDNEHFTSVQHYYELKVAKKLFVLFHYPLISWNHSISNYSYQLHGHNHCQLYNMEVFENTPESALKRKIMSQNRMDVGIDHIDCNYSPFSLDEIVDIFNKRLKYGY